MASKENKSTPEIEHHRKLKRSLLKKLTLTWLLLIIAASTAVGMIIQYGLQNSKPILQSLLNQKIKQQEVSEKKLQLTTYRSDVYGYEITFNPEVFKTDRATDLTTPDSPEIGLSTQDTAQSRGLGYIVLSALTEQESQTIFTDKKIIGKNPLEKAATWYQTKRFKDLTDTSTYVKKELVTRWGADAYKLTYKRRVLDTDVFHYIYVTIQNDKLYTILADYPKNGESEDLVESWIDEIHFLGPQTASVQAATSQKSTELNEVKLVELNKPSVVQIVSVNCVTITVKDISAVKKLKPEYQLCGGGSGSGFLIGNQGHIATNGHVVKASFDDLVYSGRPEPGSGGDFYSDLVKEVVAQEASKEASVSGTSITNKASLSKYPSTLDAVMKKVADFQKAGILDPPVFEDKYFVKLANDPIQFAKVTSANKNAFSYKTLEPIVRSNTILDAELVGYDFSGLTALSKGANIVSATNPPKRQKSSDVAIIKLKDSAGTTYPGVPMLTSDKVKEGQSLLVIGYPGLVSGQDTKSSALLDESYSSGRPTITRGIISSIKQDTFGQTLLQTDASIEHGNSGGPAFNYEGEVIGIATYVMTSGSGNYNFLRAIDDLYALMDKESIEKNQMSESYTLWKEGLSFFWEGRLVKAKANFEKIKSLYPVHPLVDEYIDNSNKGIASGEDIDAQISSQPQKVSLFRQPIVYISIMIIVSFLILIGIALTVYYLREHAKNKTLTPSQLQKLVQPPTTTQAL